MSHIGRTRITFWQGSPSPHQAGYLRHLAEIYEVNLVCSGSLSSERISLGWDKGDFGKVRLLLNPRETELEEQILAHSSSSVHIFSSLHRIPLVRRAYVKAAETKALIGLLAEGRDWRGPRGMLRRIESFTYERRIANRLDFVLAIGRMGLQWHRMCGIAEEKLFPFAYFPATYTTGKVGDDSGSNWGQQYDSYPDFRLIFVGQLIPRKRVHLLLQALAPLKTLPWELTIIGDGPERCRLEGMAQDLGFAEKILFTGILKNRQVPQAISEADLLVLPSIWDGWGAVVNEALGVGVPVVCSDYCGAQALLEGERGETFPVDSVDGLTEVLRRRIEAGRLTAETRDRIRTWSAQISGETAAKYLAHILRYLDSKQRGAIEPRPTAPWLSE